jgi:polyisoprenoid-binding protein YceI
LLVTHDTATTPTPPAPTASTRGRKGWWIVGGVAAALLVLAGVAVWYLVFRDTAPPPVNIEKASESVEQSDTTTGTAGSLSGTWTVDTTIGSFDDFSSAFVGYRVNEELAGVGAKTAFGRTPDVSGILVVDGTTVTKVDIEADLSTLQSDESFRDGSIRNQALETDTFPTATFTLTEPIELDSIPMADETVKIDAKGELTLHGVTRNVTIPLEAKRVGDSIAVTGSLDIAFADYSITKPVAARVLSIEDRGIMELQLFFSKP